MLEAEFGRLSGLVDTEKAVTFTNAGTGTLTWIMEFDSPTLPLPSWLQRVWPQAGTLREGEFSEVTFRVNRTGLTSGPYEHTVTFWSNGGMGSVLVRMTVP